MNENKRTTAPDWDPDEAPDLSRDGWPEKFARVPIRRGRPPQGSRAKVMTTIRLSPEVLEHFREGGPGWQSRIDAVLLEWVRTSR